MDWAVDLNTIQTRLGQQNIRRTETPQVKPWIIRPQEHSSVGRRRQVVRISRLMPTLDPFSVSRFVDGHQTVPPRTDTGTASATLPQHFGNLRFRAEVDLTVA